MTLGEKIIALRKSRGMSQEQLAEKVNVSRQAVSKWELNESIPDIDKVAALSRFFGVTTDYLIMAETRAGEGAPVILTESNKETRDKTKTVLSWVMTGVGAFGIMVLMVLSSLIETTVPIKGRTDDGGYWYSATRGYAFLPFVKERNLGFLLVILLFMLVAGIGFLVYKRMKDQNGTEAGEDE